MTRRKRLTQNQVAALPIKAKRYFHLDPELNGHYVRIMPTGSKTFVATTRDPNGKQVWATIGGTDLWTIDDSRDEARAIIKRIAKGLPPREAPPVKPDSYKAVAENWLKRHVEAKKLISKYEIERSVNKYLLPQWGERNFVDIKRRDISALLDKIADNHGPYMAN